MASMATPLQREIRVLQNSLGSGNGYSFLFGWTERTEQQNHMIPKAFSTAGLLGTTCPFCGNLSLYPSPAPAPARQPSALQPAQSQLILQFHGSRGSLVCGSLWVSIYRKTQAQKPLPLPASWFPPQPK